MIKALVIADARSRISSDEPETLQRHQDYINQFRKYEGFSDTLLLVMQPAIFPRKIKCIEIGSIRIYQVSIFKFINTRRLFEREASNVLLFIAGDPWESFIYMKILKRYLGKLSTPAQVQVHAELSLAWKKLKLTNRLRVHLAWYALKHADNIRTVTRTQREFLIRSYELAPEKVSTVAVRLNLTGDNYQEISFPRPTTIGFVGRIHRERNVREFIEIACAFLKINPGLKIAIATKGSKNRKLSRELSRLPNDRLELFENLNTRDMPEFWRKIGVLISTAESESFGRSIREALVHGVPVIAHSSMGARELQIQCPDSVLLYDADYSISELFTKFAHLMSVRINDNFPSEQRKLENSLAAEIAETWKSTIQKHQFM
jgi:glycosyltransferase involved in cell wall biosynthesis